MGAPLALLEAKWKAFLVSSASDALCDQAEGREWKADVGSNLHLSDGILIKALGSKPSFLMQTRGLRLKAGPFVLPTRPDFKQHVLSWWRLGV